MNEFYAADSNHDGLVSASEAAKLGDKFAEVFDTLERDGDGSVTMAELLASYNATK